MPILERKIAHKMTTLCSHITYPEFFLPLHKHAEYELMIFTHGSGKQFVGEGVAPYAEGDVALIGSNVPHLHLCKSRMKSGGNAGKDNSEKIEIEESGNIKLEELGHGLENGLAPELEDRLYSSGEAIQFSPQLFPSSLLNLPDYAHISELLSKSQYGIRFYDEGLYDELLEMMKAFDSSTHTSRLIILLQILDRLHHCKKTQLLSPTAYSNANRQPELEEPIGRIYTYLYNNFREKVVLKDVADFVGQNPTSLCRYFKKSTDKSIFQVLAEIRIEYACKLLANSDLTITEVAFSSGYNTPTLFFEQFQKIIHLTPAEYRREINGTSK